jgi:diguanylate cyclase (GGDEF)-like protein
MDIHPEKDLPYVLDQVERQIRKEFALAKDLPVIRKDGSVFYADVCAFPIPLEGKECLVGFFRDVTERKRYEQQLAHLASHDSLTGLANRRLFEEEAHRAVLRARRGTPSTLLLFDLDHFKAANDALGHAAGDDLLVRITKLVQGCLRGEDLLARIGGDEFAVLLEGAPAAEAGAVAERIRQAVHDSACPADGHVHPTLSIGLVKIDGQHDVVPLIAKADAAMYEAKDQGRNRIVCAEAAPAT